VKWVIDNTDGRARKVFTKLELLKWYDSLQHYKRGIKVQDIEFLKSGSRLDKDDMDDDDSDIDHQVGRNSSPTCWHREPTVLEASDDEEYNEESDVFFNE
jgi:hypothetical protein